MENPIFIMIIAYMAIQLLVCLWASRLIRNESDYILAGRNVGMGLAMFSLFATWFGAETVMGSSAAVAESGLSGSRADPFGYTICLFLMGFLVAGQLRRKEYVTAGDFFRDRFSRPVELLAVMTMLPSSIFWSAAQILAFGQILSVVTGGGIEQGLLISTGLVITYTVIGGMWGDIITDFIQGIVLIAGLAVLLGFVIMHAGGVQQAFSSITPEQLSFVAPDESLLSRVDTWMVPILGSLIAQEALGRLLATKSVSVARNASFSGALLYFIIGAIPVLIALIASHFDLQLEHRDEFLPELAQKLLPPPLFALLIGALASAILSTINTTLLTFSSLIAHNIVLPRLKHLNEKEKVFLIRVMVVLAGILSYFIATSGDNIYALVETSSSFGSAGLVVVVLAGLWFKKGGPITAMMTLVAGLTVTLLGNYVYEWEAPFITAIAVCAAVFSIGSLLGGMMPAQKEKEHGKKPA